MNRFWIRNRRSAAGRLSLRSLRMVLSGIFDCKVAEKQPIPNISYTVR